MDMEVAAEREFKAEDATEQETAKQDRLKAENATERKIRRRNDGLKVVLAYAIEILLVLTALYFVVPAEFIVIGSPKVNTD